MYSQGSLFAPARGAAAAANAYHQVGVQTDVVAASPHKLVAMLFDGFLDALAQAQGAIAQGDIALKCKAITRALDILNEGLRGGLNMEEGGPLAAELNGLYGYIGTRLLEANLRSSPELLSECKRLIEPLREAWTAVGPRVDSQR